MEQELFEGQHFSISTYDDDRIKLLIRLYKKILAQYFTIKIIKVSV